MLMWNQVYDPFNNIWLSALVATIPILLFIILLTVLKIKGHIAGLISAIIAGLIAIVFYGMPISKTVWTGIYGVLAGLYPVASIVLAAIFLYKLTVKTGKFDIIKKSITSMSPDKRIQVIIVAYCFGAFLEGAAGFGAPVAITAIILVGLGFDPVKAAGICLVANIAGGSFGAMGIPVTTPAQLTGLDPLDVAMRTTYIIPFVTFVLPFLLVFLVDGIRGIKETFKTILVAAVTFTAVLWATLNTIGAPLVDILSASITLIVLYIYLRPKQQESVGTLIRAWSPFIFLTLLVIVFSKLKFESLIMNFPIPTLNGLINKVPPVVSDVTPFGAVFTLDLLSSTTSAIVYASLLTILIFKVKRSIIKQALKETVKELVIPIATICAVLAFAYICNYSGMSSTLGLAFASTGGLFPLFSPVLGWIGVFLTGSVVNSGSLFAPLQVITAEQVGLSPAGMVASNIVGGDMAKMLSPQSIAVAAAAVGLVGRESEIFKYTIKISLIFLAFVGIINLIIY
ncbi:MULTISPECIES: L-lactate permease [Priestia]|uniref:L-lactate permease n=1 Tax=Priestia flexa TaxID=86664 RepID=A0ABU4J5Q8_9BACI|nr:lactate permease LctP family transporter [Priestia flexa]USY54277.1 lactate permease LctP family transporter [Bacillus sp. 1780r2a1]MCM3065459.1 lactate permease LctP family transporter [Priestia flexa]MDW8516320.1 lactate permease LctP family transporter [Priestia flexa]MED4588949.1 lactate permease LctP family transporter [Priestia flexa]WEZ09787.1 lactate permease LctP family transporter [Priestia flexa]